MVSHKKSHRRGSARQKRRSLTRRNVKSRKVMRGGKLKDGEFDTELYKYKGQYIPPIIPHGEGRMFFKKINYEYTGTFQNGAMSGKGIMKLPDGTTFDGDWNNNDPIGKGIIKWNTGEKTFDKFPYPDPENDAASAASTDGVPDGDDLEFFAPPP